MKKSKKLRPLCRTLILAAPACFNIGVLITLFVFLCPGRPERLSGLLSVFPS
jgi:hypothetical protein